jgi:hypothetical protein
LAANADGTFKIINFPFTQLNNKVNQFGKNQFGKRQICRIVRIPTPMYPMFPSSWSFRFQIPTGRQNAVESFDGDASVHCVNGRWSCTYQSCARVIISDAFDGRSQNSRQHPEYGRDTHRRQTPLACSIIEMLFILRAIFNRSFVITCIGKPEPGDFVENVDFIVGSGWRSCLKGIAHGQDSAQCPN